MAKAARKQAIKVEAPHQCSKTDRGYEWPCPVCQKDYYRPHSGILWYVLVITGGTEIEQKGPFTTEYDADRYARGRFKRLDDSTDSIFWLKIRDGKAFTGDYHGGFFERR